MKTKLNTIFSIVLFFFVSIPQTAFSQTATCGTADVVGTLAEWNFETWPPNCARATPNPSFNPTEPRFEQGLYTFCPNEASSCANAVLGSAGHANTSVFANGICLLNFYDPDFAQQSYGGTTFDPNSTTFDPDGGANLFIEYVIPAGQESCLSDFSLVVLQKQYDGSTVNFETQGVAVKRNGLLIHTESQTITTANINNTPMNFSFAGDDFCSDGLAEVTFTIVFGLVHRLVPAGDYTSPATTGYDDIKIEGMCGGPAGYATTIRSGCITSGSANNGQITLSNFAPSVRFDFNAGTTYTGAATYATATPLPSDNVITNSLTNPTGTQDYTIRVFDVSGCFVDEIVTLYERACPVPCNEPAGMTFVATPATCSGTTSDDNGSIQVNGVTGGDKIEMSSDGTNFDYTTANNLAAGAFTFSGLGNPTGYQNYTIRIYNGSACYIDRTVTLEENPCGPCSNGVWEIISSDQSDPDSGVNNGNTSEDDYVTFESCKGNDFIDLNLTKTVDVATGNVGTTTFTFTLTLNNAGTMDAENIQVADLMPKDLHITNAVPSMGIYGRDLGWIIDVLGAGQTTTLDISVIALQAGVFENCTFVNDAFPNNDPNSITGNDQTANEDDDDCASITVTGNVPPTITKAFSPENTVTGTPTRLTLKIWNNENANITLSTDLVDNLPNSPAQMTIATDPNIISDIGGVTAVAGASAISVASGTALPPGLSQIHVDVIMPIDGYYCNTIEAGDLSTNSGNNILATTACVAANSTYCMPPVLSAFLPAMALNTSANLTINIENRNASDMTVEMDANLYFPTGLELATGSNTGTVSGISFSAGDAILVIPTGVVLSSGMNTIIVPVQKTINDVDDFQIPMNALLVSACGTGGLGNEDVTIPMSSCTEPTASIFAIQPSCTDGSANSDGYLQLSAVTDGDRVNFSIGNTYTGDADYANATTIGALPFQFNTGLANPSGSQDYTVRVFNGASDCFIDVVLAMNEQDCTVGCDCKDNVYLNDVDFDIIHKFRVDENTGALTEIGNPWNDLSENWDPHGIAIDINGYLYIAETTSGDVRKLDCDGNLIDANFIENTSGDLFTTNFGSHDGSIYLMDVVSEEIKAYSLCDGSYIGAMEVDGGDDVEGWGFYVDEDNWYMSNRKKNGIYSGSLDISLFTNPATTSGIRILPPTIIAPMGITKDNAGNYYIIRGQDLTGTGTDVVIAKYSSAGVEVASVVDNTNGGNNTSNGESDFWGSRGIVYSEASGLLYLSGYENCISVFDTSLVQQQALNIGNPANGDAKGIGILSECCPTNNNVTIDTTLCAASISDLLFLQELVNCNGTICEGIWEEGIGNTGLTYNSCDNTVRIDALTACGTFTLESDGTGNNPQCGAFKLTVNIEVENVTAPVIAGDQTVCPSDDPVAFTITTAATSSGIINYQWQSSTTDCTTGFSNINAATSATYDSPAVSQTTYYRVLSSVNGSCSSGMCADTSNCVALTLDVGCTPVCSQPTASITAIQATCAGGANSDGYLQLSTVTNGDRVNFSTGNTYTGDADYANATTIGVLPFQFNTGLANPSGSQDYTARVFNGASDCFTDIIVTLTETTCCPPMRCVPIMVTKNGGN